MMRMLRDEWIHLQVIMLVKITLHFLTLGSVCRFTEDGNSSQTCERFRSFFVEKQLNRGFVL